MTNVSFQICNILINLTYCLQNDDKKPLTDVNIPVLFIDLLTWTSIVDDSQVTTDLSDLSNALNDCDFMQRIGSSLLSNLYPFVALDLNALRANRTTASPISPIFVGNLCSFLFNLNMLNIYQAEPDLVQLLLSYVLIKHCRYYRLSSSFVVFDWTSCSSLVLRHSGFSMFVRWIPKWIAMSHRTNIIDFSNKCSTCTQRLRSTYDYLSTARKICSIKQWTTIISLKWYLFYPMCVRWMLFIRSITGKVNFILPIWLSLFYFNRRHCRISRSIERLFNRQRLFSVRQYHLLIFCFIVSFRSRIFRHSRSTDKHDHKRTDQYIDIRHTATLVVVNGSMYTRWR
jgi:hypothetical protein